MDGLTTGRLAPGRPSWQAWSNTLYIIYVYIHHTYIWYILGLIKYILYSLNIRQRDCNWLSILFIGNVCHGGFPSTILHVWKLVQALRLGDSGLYWHSTSSRLSFEAACVCCLAWLVHLTTCRTSGAWVLYSKWYRKFWLDIGVLDTLCQFQPVSFSLQCFVSCFYTHFDSRAIPKSLNISECCPLSYWV